MAMHGGDIAKYLGQAAGKATVSEHAHPEDQPPSEPPPPDGWRYRRTGSPRWFAVAGVVVGLLMFLVPGLLALRSYVRWQRGTQALPSLAWTLAALALWSLVAAAIWFAGSPPIAVVTSIVAVPAICLAAWRI